MTTMTARVRNNKGEIVRNPTRGSLQLQRDLKVILKGFINSISYEETLYTSKILKEISV
jgi:hypothetical protein